MTTDLTTLESSSRLAATPTHASLRALTLGALGVVFGDIGTSPLYAFRACFTGAHAVEPTEANVIGVLSLIFWSLIVVISIKYVAIMLRADHRGEGGVLALSTLLANATPNWRLWSPVAAGGVLGAALFFGDGMLTPAVSVLSAVEGLTVAAPSLQAVVLPVTTAILIGLFVVQKRGTGTVGRVFGPIIIVWFLTLGVLGTVHILDSPRVLLALNPVHAIELFVANGWQAFLVLSAVFLVVTGGEALYADLGHFGRIPIRNAWMRLVLPALTLNYLGQGALVLADPDAMRNPFYLLAPTWLLPPLIVLATAATIIASQAVISGVFSVASQAMNLGYLPRIRIQHSSASAMGQIYVPAANWVLLLGTVVLVLVFGSSEALASAYGIAVSATMLLAGIMVALLAYARNGTRNNALCCLLVAICLIDLAFFCANSMRVLDGGWVSIVVALGAYFVMSTWNEGRRTVNWAMARQQIPLRDFLQSLSDHPPVRLKGTAVYLTNEANSVPRALVQQLKLQGAMHERLVILTFVRAEAPRLTPEERLEVSLLAPDIHRVTAKFGFMEQPNTLSALRLADKLGLPFEPEKTVYVVGRTTPLPMHRKGMSIWRKRLYALMARNSRAGYHYFGVPPHLLLEIGSYSEL